MSVDQKSYDLAKTFLHDWAFEAARTQGTQAAYQALHDNTEVMGLAQQIQKTIEDWLEELAERQKVEPACKHRTRGLCLDCWDDYQEDPTAWAEYGYHAQGEANTKKLFAELAEMPPETEEPIGPHIPF
jgi:hypothetical protein